VDKVVAGPKLRCTTPLIDPGGGGVNVARAIDRLGGDVTAMVLVGGTPGDQLLDLLAKENLKVQAIRTEAETRFSFAVTETPTNDQYRFSLPAVPLTPAEATGLPEEIAQAVPPGSFVVLSGSLPPGLPVNFPAALQATLKPKTDRLILDTSGPALFEAVKPASEPLYLLRIDHKESCEAAGRELKTIDDSISYAASLVERGTARIVVTGCGAAGSILVTKDERIFCTAPNVPVRSKIGAGDSFVGALTHQLAKGASLTDALCWGVAAASATVMTEGTALCHATDIERLLPECVAEAR